MNRQKEIEFMVGYSCDINIQPETYVKAAVPGAVQLDWAKASQWPPYYFAENWREYTWMEDMYWHYSAKLDLTLEAGKRIFLCGKGIDYKYVIKLNRKKIYEYEGMFSPFELELTEYRDAEVLLEISIYPVPKKEGKPDDRSQASHCCKPAVSYGWDWHPRLIPLGIWDEIHIEYREQKHIRSAEIRYELSEEFKSAEIDFFVEASDGRYDYLFRLYDANENLVLERGGYSDAEGMHIHEVLQDVALWWPNGYGSPTLYRAEVQLLEEGKLLDRWEGKTGFRKVELVVHQGGWDEPRTMPKSRSFPPATMKINGTKIFCKGSNWVQPEIFYGCIDPDEYRTLLTLAKEANFNILRSWGGGIINKDVFFDICDELGIMIWQEFPLACNDYEDDTHYLEVLDAESKAIIRRVRRHPSLVLWCGGNELFNAWSRMTEQSHALRLLNKNCYELDRETPFIMTSPLDGMAHGGYVFRDGQGIEVYESINRAANTAYTEFACPSISDMEILRLALPEEELAIPKDGTSWVSHHGLYAWTDNTWATPDVIAHYFGEAGSLHEMIEQSNILQSEGLKAIFEEARRQQPKCSMALNWCYNEPWPTAAGNNLVTWKHTKKPAYYAVAAALRNTMVSARNYKFMWTAGECFYAELWILNDSLQRENIGEITAVLSLNGTEYELLKWMVPSIGAQRNIQGPVVRMELPKANDGELLLKLLVDGNEKLNSSYTFRYRGGYKEEKQKTTPVLNM